MLAIRNDETVVCTAKRDSLFKLFAESNCERANRLGKLELLAVIAAASRNPFPLGSGEATYREVIAALKLAQGGATLWGEMPPAWALDCLRTELATYSVGKLRLALVAKCGDSCNGPWDSYLRCAAEIAAGERVTEF